jgi:hypothetical protein
MGFVNYHTVTFGTNFNTGIGTGDDVNAQFQRYCFSIKL